MREAATLACPLRLCLVRSIRNIRDPFLHDVATFITFALVEARGMIGFVKLKHRQNASPVGRSMLIAVASPEREKTWIVRSNRSAISCG
jgi:hypothetical protein